MQCSTRVSKSCNHAITRLRKIFENLRKFWTNERETGKTKIMYLSQFDKVFQLSQVLCNFYSMFLCKNFNQSILIAQKN